MENINMSSMLQRDRRVQEILTLLRDVPCVAILGARQVGKTTLAGFVADAWGQPVHRFDLERSADVARLGEPELALEPLEGLIVLDEVQRVPEIFPALRVFLDRHPDRRVLVLGSAAPELLHQSSETLAGRIAFHDLTPLTLDETGVTTLDELWLRGGFPRSFLARDEPTSFRWRVDFIRTFIERDLPALGSRVPPATTGRFWRMLAHVHGQVWNASRFASSFGVADTTVRRYLDLLVSSLVVRELRPWHENVGKREVRSPKVYIADSGVLHALLDLPDRVAVERHPSLGASWEGFVLDQIIAATRARPEQRYFWAVHTGAELDFLIVRGNERIGFEIKRTVAPKLTRSLHFAKTALRLDRSYVVHAGEATYPLAEGIEALSARDLATRTDL
jgi:uncharacterized protein